MFQTSLPQEGLAKSVRGNRRATVRYRCAPATLGKVYLGDDDHEYQRACIIDLSTLGVGMQLGRPLGVGQFIHISVKSTDETRIFELSAVVAHCSLQPLGDWYLGCELTIPLTPDDLDQLL